MSYDNPFDIDDLRDSRERDRDDYYRSSGYDIRERDFHEMYGDLPERSRPSEYYERMEMEIKRSARVARYERVYRDSMLVRESSVTRDFDWYFN